MMTTSRAGASRNISGRRSNPFSAARRKSRKPRSITRLPSTSKAWLLLRASTTLWPIVSSVVRRVRRKLASSSVMRMFMCLSVASGQGPVVNVRQPMGSGQCQFFILILHAGQMAEKARSQREVGPRRVRDLFPFAAGYPNPRLHFRTTGFSCLSLQFQAHHADKESWICRFCR